MDDGELVRRFREGDDRAFALLYDRYQDWVAGLAFRLTRNQEDALDVLQDAFAYLVRKRPTLELEGPFKSLLYPVVRHLSLDRLRARRRPLPPSPPAPPAPAGPDEDLLRGLSDAQAEVVRMRFTDSLDLQAIADALDVPLGTVKSRLHSALEILRGRLSNR
jgi:RNA polymerase sigma-70 factor (ECF subfamily)